ncbi:hypothetical protein [Caldinitratiruptor microaerophilus]|uniref:Uncharacterized protein n=1 Tax=Caldinitratiruptor microaerophilus TaxID=671077 RepID=A0AA35CPA7_9FIRM|nr:hypothetical protein [Caldinitratiruptor microaerophilus]BDG61180.1 hypothetical protein caldi_22700 [Caldinitratiruptor microaerophilus]
MHLGPYAGATYALITHWAVGIALTVAVADTEVGLIRDHPLYGRRLSGRVVPPLATTGLLSPFLLNGHLHSLPPRWVLVSMALMLPFAWLSWRWAKTWVGWSPALRRRRLGVWAVGAGLAAVALSNLLALRDLQPAWRMVIPMSIFAGTVALPGALTNLSLMALTAGLPAEVPGGPARGVAEVGGFGVLVNLLALGDAGLAWLQSGGSWPAPAGAFLLAWAAGALAIPGSILLARLWWRTMPDAIFMPAALVSAVVGQWFGLALIFRFPGLVPPIRWS